MSKKNLHPIPTWMHLDNRPLDKGEWQKYGYGYSRPVTSYERWRPATRYIRRQDTKRFKGFSVITLMPGWYYVSDRGRIWCAFSGKIINYRKHKRSRTFLKSADGSQVRVRQYKLALDNFIEPPDHIKHVVYYLLPIVNHIDNRPYNNRVDNLQYTNYSGNNEHARLFTKKEK